MRHLSIFRAGGGIMMAVVFMFMFYSSHETKVKDNARAAITMTHMSPKYFIENLWFLLIIIT